MVSPLVLLQIKLVSLDLWLAPLELQLGHKKLIDLASASLHKARASVEIRISFMIGVRVGVSVGVRDTAARTLAILAK